MLIPAAYISYKRRKPVLFFSLLKQMILFPVWVVFRSILGKKLDTWFPDNQEELPSGIGAGDFRIVFLT